MPQSLTPIHMGGTLSERANGILLVAAKLGAFVILYLLAVGMVWLMGQYHHYQYGNDSWFVDQVSVQHPFLTCAAIFAVASVASAVLIVHDQAFGPKTQGSLREGVADAAALYGEALSAATGPRPDLVRAHGLLAQAHAAGSPAAAYALASWHARGIVVDRDPAAWERLVREASAADVPAALYDLALAQRDGISLPADAASAYQGLLRAALFGHPFAGLEVARCLEAGEGTARDATAASSWRDAVAARGDRGRPGGAWPWDVVRP